VIRVGRLPVVKRSEPGLAIDIVELGGLDQSVCPA